MIVKNEVSMTFLNTKVEQAKFAIVISPSDDFQERYNKGNLFDNSKNEVTLGMLKRMQAISGSMWWVFWVRIGVIEKCSCLIGDGG